MTESPYGPLLASSEHDAWTLSYSAPIVPFLVIIFLIRSFFLRRSFSLILLLTFRRERDLAVCALELLETCDSPENSIW